MQEIELRESMFDSVKNGTKLATLRKGVREYSIGETLIIGTERTRSMICEVLSVNVKPLGKVTDEDAQKEGYNNRQELIDIMENIYGNLSDEEMVTQVNFRFLEEL